MTCRRPYLQATAWWIAALAMTAVAFGLRIHALGVPNLTGDEWFMLRNHDQGPLWIIHQAHTFEPHPLLYYLGLAGWIEVAGRTEFAMRFPSVLFGVLLVPGLMDVARALVGPRAGLIAGALVALNPYQIAESQNARNYAMVVSLSALASLLFVRALKSQRQRDWFVYGIAMLLALNTHLDAALVLMVHVAYVGIAWLVKHARRNHSIPAVRSAAPGSHDDGAIVSPGLAGEAMMSAPRAWLVTTSVIVVVFCGWLLYAWPALLAYHGYFPEQVSLERVLARSLATFSLGKTEPVRQAVPAFALAVVGMGWLAARKPRSALFLGLYTLLPIFAVSLLFLVRPMFDERYLIVLAPGFLVILAAGLDGLLRELLPVGIMVAAGALVLLVLRIPQTYQTMLTDRADYRAMATWISTYGNPDDPIVATGFGQAELFGYYYSGPQKVRVLDQPTELATQIPSLLRQHDGLWLLPYWHSSVDEAALSTLDRAAVPSAERWFVNVRALYYASTRRLSQESSSRATWDGRITLDQASVTSGEITPGDAFAVELHWKITAPIATPKLSLRLLDQSGSAVAQSDAPLSQDHSLAAGDGVTRIGLLVPPVVPPGAYTAAVVLYQADTGSPLALSTRAPSRDGALVLGSVEVGLRHRPVPASEAGIGSINPVSFAEGVSLLGHDALGPPRQAGDWLSFQLLWRADRSQLPTVQHTLTLRDQTGHDVPVLKGPILPSFPTSRWSRGAMFAERVRFQIPPNAMNGAYHLLVSTGSASEPSVSLGDVFVSGPNRSFVKPSVPRPIQAKFGAFATLLGDRVDGTPARPGSSVDVTLFWQARGTADKSYTAFVHLIDPAGKIRGQSDQLPVNGTRPTDGWVAGEYLTDEYRPRLVPDAPAGQYRIEAGFYDPRSGARVPVTLSNGSQSDHVILGTFEVVK